MGGSEGASSAPAHEAGGRSQTEARRLQEGNVRSLGQTRFEPISTRTGASPSFLRRLQRQSVSSLSFGSPFSRRNGRFVGAHRRAAIQRSVMGPFEIQPGLTAVSSCARHAGHAEASQTPARPCPTRQIRDRFGDWRDTLRNRGRIACDQIRSIRRLKGREGARQGFDGGAPTGDCEEGLRSALVREETNALTRIARSPVAICLSFYYCIGLTPTKIEASGGGPTGIKGPIVANPPTNGSSEETAWYFPIVFNSAWTNSESLPVIWIARAIDPLPWTDISNSALVENPAFPRASTICEPRTAPSASKAYEESHIHLPEESGFRSLTISSCSFGCNRRGAISLLSAKISPSKIVWRTSEDTHMSASQNSSPRMPTITTQVAMATQGQWKPVFGGIQRFSIFSAYHSAINPITTTTANTTNPNSPRESALSAESFVPGAIGDPERRFQIRLGILCMMATGLAFAGWLAWGLVWLLLRLCGRNWKLKRTENA
jgi:hypothetical protein